MKYKIIAIIALVITSHGMCGAADKPLIDPEYQKVAEEINRVTAACMQKQKSPIKKFQCGKDLRQKYEQEGKIRGTETYCEANYTDLNFGELENVFKNLRTQQKTARSSMDVMFDDEKPGEVTKEDLQTELIWIESRLAGLQKSNIKKMEKGIKYKPGWEPKKE